MTYPQRVKQLVKTMAAGTPQQKRDEWYRLIMHCRGIDLRSNSVEELGLSKLRSLEHGNSGGPGLEIVLKTLNILPTDSILDIGCGKGGAMITFAQWPFSRIDGIEISPDLIAIARRNLKRLSCIRGTIRLCDAADFREFDAYTLLYLYHPFTQVVMTSVLDNIRSSLARFPRRTTLMYKNPVY